MAKELCQFINDFRLNKFVIKVNVCEGWMLYNTTTGSIVHIHSTEDLYKSLDTLINMYFYVPLAFDEVKWVNELRITKNRKSKDRLINGFTIFTTMDCNARCFYCYEKGQPRISMTDKIAKDTADFILKTSSNSPVEIRWFGGEPLLNTNAIDIICNTLTKNGAKFKSSMITNGLLFTDSIISKAKKLWKLKRVQITLDGPKDVYHKAKSYKGAVGDEFDRVIYNIGKLIKDQITVSIRLNQGLYNTSDLLDLINFLSDHFGGKDSVSVYNSLLYDQKVELDNLSETEMYERFIMIQNKLIKSGLFRNKPLKKKIRYCHCMADNDSSVIITPKGDIGKCEHFTNEHLVGNIYDSQFDSNEIQRWKEQYQPTLKCINCPLYPQCVRIRMCPEERESCTLSQCENKIELIQRALINKFELLTRR